VNQLAGESASLRASLPSDIRPRANFFARLQSSFGQRREAAKIQVLIESKWNEAMAASANSSAFFARRKGARKPETRFQGVPFFTLSSPGNRELKSAFRKKDFWDHPKSDG